ncbi:MAG: T9SS type A sorting domain-containing protein, partial [Bacteroidota bacterium]
MRVLGLLCLGFGLALASSAQPGALDPLFGTDGNVSFRLSEVTFAQLRDVAIDQEANIYTLTYTQSVGMYVSKTGPDGLVAETLNQVRIRDAFGRLLEPTTLTPSHEGGVMLAGSVWRGTSPFTFPVPFTALLRADGNADSSFGSNGVYEYPDSLNSLFPVSLHRAGSGFAILNDSPNLSYCPFLYINANGSVREESLSDGSLLTLRDDDCGSIRPRLSDTAEGVSFVSSRANSSSVRLTFVQVDAAGLETSRSSARIRDGAFLPFPFAAYRDSQGRFVVAMIGSNETKAKGLTLRRFTSDGDADLTFGHGGVIRDTLFLPASDAPDARFLTSQDRYGQLLYARSSSEDTMRVLAVSAFNADGSRHTDFGEDGISVLAETKLFQTSPRYTISAIRVDPENRIVLGVITSRTNSATVTGSSKSVELFRLKGLPPAPVDSGNEALRQAQVLLAPNPAASSTTLRLTLASPTEATLTVYDALGRLAHTRTDVPLRAGENTLALDTRSYPPGIYAVVLTTSRERWT